MSDQKPHALAVLSEARSSAAAKLNALKHEMRALISQLKSLDTAIATLSVGRPEEIDCVVKKGLTVKRMILDRLPALNGSRGTSPIEIARAITESGRETGATVVSSYLSRFVSSGEAKKLNGSWYRGPKYNDPEHDPRP